MCLKSSVNLGARLRRSRALAVCLGATAMKEFVVDFHLPGDGIFDHHGTNFVGRSKSEARDAVERHIPGASVLSVSEGMICLYGRPYVDYDAFAGAYCTPKK